MCVDSNARTEGDVNLEEEIVLGHLPPHPLPNKVLRFDITTEELFSQSQHNLN